MKSMCHDARRNSPSVADWRPTSSCIRTASRIARLRLPAARRRTAGLARAPRGPEQLRRPEQAAHVISPKRWFGSHQYPPSSSAMTRKVANAPFAAGRRSRSRSGGAPRRFPRLSPFRRPPGCKTELVLPVQCDQGHQGDRAPRAPVEPGARPDLTPGVAGDQILEGGRVPRRSCDRGVDVLVAEDLAADPHPFAVPIVHATSSIDVARCSVTRLETRPPARRSRDVRHPAEPRVWRSGSGRR